jgi:putative spermidine/putrescine transport system permease protein
VFALILGLLIAEGLQKSKFKGKSFVTELFMLPMLIPGIIVGISLFKFESQLKLNGTLTGLIVAHTVLAVPFVVRTVLASLSGLNPNYELAAQNLGANRLQTFMKITFPIIKPAIFSGAMFAFATSFDEIVVSQFICGTKVKTLPKVIWDGLNQQLDPTITSIATIMITVITIIMIVLNAHDIFYKKPKIMEEDMLED